MKKILLTGATGYIGSQLLNNPDFRKNQVRCLVRDPGRLFTDHSERLEIITGDVFNPSLLKSAMTDIDTAFYLIHSMDKSNEFESRDREAAQNFAGTARAAGVNRIIYLGGLGDPATRLSPHLRSRHEVGKILQNSGVLTIELRASIVLGSGSLSFELLGTLTERLPVMITPRWVKVLSQPIGIDDLLAYLIQAINLEIKSSMIFEIGGSDQATYQELMSEYARQRGLRRIMIPVPFLTPRLSGLWLGLVTPVNAHVGKKLLNSIFYPTIVNDNSAEKYFSVNQVTVSEAISRALKAKENDFFLFSTRQNMLKLSSVFMKKFFANRLIDNRIKHIRASSACVFRVISMLGGKNGWYGYNWLWRLRGLVDYLAGGSGFRHTRPSRNYLAVGDILDFWRVDAIIRDVYIRLAGELRLPGKAWLEFELQTYNDQCILRQTAVFYPRGLAGILYWYALYPFHQIVLGQLIRRISRHAIYPGPDIAGNIKSG